ncbi:MAG: 1-deoxy-D-xylulose-5-phosphate reductoisomerase [Peptococcaceae bacterium]|nr:1-deoxy-D-xylulose-5-phosphate reductoisomerase [Peptococcaceae bacterium]
MKGISILGSTGSIGRQALEVIDLFPDRFAVVGLAAGRNIKVLREQIKKYRPRVVSVSSRDDARLLAEEFGREGCRVLWGDEGLLAAATCPGAHTVLTALTGTAGLMPTLAAIKAGRDIALANKETLVAAGSLVTGLAEKHGVKILPVDSEHSAIWQCLQGSKPGEVEGIILTASGGPFRKQPEDLSLVTVSMALDHPNWNMGKKITVDSATLMNKGLEVIEARWLFGLDYGRIKVVIHPQSIIHSMVEFVDGSVVAQLGLPDMRLPIQYALGYPRRLPGRLPRLDWNSARELTFDPPDTARFPLLETAYRAGRLGGTAPAVMNAANEVAVEFFLAGRIGFMSIHRVVEEVLGRHRVSGRPDLEDILEADREARQLARRLAEKLNNF